MITEKKSKIKKLENIPYINYNYAIVEREKPRNRYKEINPGEKRELKIHNYFSDGSSRFHSETTVVKDVNEGGFVGEVLTFEDKPFVEKTTQPRRPLKRFLRAINWDYLPFPAQTNELDARIQHITVRIIHNVIFYASKGKFYAPDSYGYAQTPGGGFSQLVERVEGRPTELRKEKDDTGEFKKAQEELTELCDELGFEQMGQIHPKNPYGMQNLWFDPENNRFIWIDTIPAIPHRGKVKLFFGGVGINFDFHKDIVRRFGGKRVTFNKIHTDRLVAFVLNNKKMFPPSVLSDIMSDIKIYADLWKEKEDQELPQPNKEEAIAALKEVGENIGRAILKFIPDRINTLRRVITDPNFVDEILLSGVKEGRKLNLVTQAEYQDAISVFEKDQVKRKTYHDLFRNFLVTSGVIDIIEWSSYGLGIALAPFIEDKGFLPTFGFIMGEIFPSFLRPYITLRTHMASKVNLMAAGLFSIIPKVGGYFAVPLQIGISERKAGIIAHFKLREFVANLSKIAFGGWGSEHESNIWKRGVQFIDFLTKKDSSGF